MVVESGQAGLATSYWLAPAGAEHQVLERRDALGGARRDRWDNFYLNTTNSSFMLPELKYDTPERCSRARRRSGSRRRAAGNLIVETVGGRRQRTWSWRTAPSSARASLPSVGLPGVPPP
ncbi:hypothetical protein VUN84_03885 [Micrococcaceae bacterium Sec5.8]